MISYRALGAAGVMGESAHLIEFDGAAVLLDAGCDVKTGAVASGRAAQAAGVRAVVLSHAHLDHSGGLPVMLRSLPTSPVVATAGTRALADLALRDHLHRARARAGRGGLPFSALEVERIPWRIQALASMVPLWAGGPECTLLDAGHLVGAAGVLLAHGGRTLFYTGDTHLQDRAFLRGARWPTGPVDVLVMETTQGANGALDEVRQDALEAALLGFLGRVLARGGQVLVPVFALGRAQEIAVLIRRAFDDGTLPRVPVYLGGLASKVNALAERFTAPERRTRAELGPTRLATRPFRSLTDAALPEGPCLFLAGSGMLSDGSISGRLAERLLRHERNGLAFVGYLDPESPGYGVRAALGGSAQVEAFPFSAHAARRDLVEAAARLRPRHVVLIHGDETARAWFAERLAVALPDARVHRPQREVPVRLEGP